MPYKDADRSNDYHWLPPPLPPEKKTRKEKKLCVGRRVVGLGRRDRKLENQDRTTLETSRSDYGDSHRPSPPRRPR